MKKGTVPVRKALQLSGEKGRKRLPILLHRLEKGKEGKGDRPTRWTSASSASTGEKGRESALAAQNHCGEDRTGREGRRPEGLSGRATS